MAYLCRALLEKALLYFVLIISRIETSKSNGIRSRVESSSVFLDSERERQQRQEERTLPHKQFLEEDAQADYHAGAHGFVLAGVIDDGSKISSEALDFLVNLNCLQGVMTHVLVRTNDKILHDMHSLMKNLKYSYSGKCADFYVTTQPPYIASYDNRVEKLQHVREHQRTEIEVLLLANSATKYMSLADVVIIVADFDLEEFPLPGQVLKSAIGMISPWRKESIASSSASLVPDVMCAAGTVESFTNGNTVEGYYDTYATILLPDTFVYPVHGRMIAKLNPADDPSLIIGSNFTNVDLLRWFYYHAQKQFIENEKVDAGGETEHLEPISYGSKMMFNPVPVRSCFGGLALYRGSKWLHPQCSYLEMDRTNENYSIRAEKRPCEHVIFHRCLSAVENGTVIAVQPDLRTRWVSSEKKKEQAPLLPSFQD